MGMYRWVEIPTDKTFRQRPKGGEPSRASLGTSLSGLGRRRVAEEAQRLASYVDAARTEHLLQNGDG